MDEGRKRTILISACVLVSPKFAQLGPQSSPTLEAAIADAIVMAEKIMQKIDRRSAVPPDQSMTSNANYARSAVVLNSSQDDGKKLHHEGASRPASYEQHRTPAPPGPG